MSRTGLTEEELIHMHAIFRHFPEIDEVLLFGSRAKGNYTRQSDVDLALVGVLNVLQAEAVAEALDSLPMPYLCDVKAYCVLRYPPILEHIKRVGISI